MTENVYVPDFERERARLIGLWTQLQLLKGLLEQNLCHYKTPHKPLLSVFQGNI